MAFADILRTRTWRANDVADLIDALQATSVGGGGTVSSSFIPNSNNAYDLGNSSNAFRTIYVGTSILSTAASILLGATSVNADLSSSNPRLLLQMDASAQEAAFFVATGANVAGASLHFNKTRSSANDANTIVSANDYLGNINFWGADGGSYRRGAFLIAQVVGTPGASDMPTDLIFGTCSDGSSGAVERFRLRANGNFEQDATNGGSICMEKSATRFIWGGTSINSDVTSAIAGNTCFIAVADHNSSCGFVSIGNQANTSGGAISLAKTRSTSSDANTIVQNGDILGNIFFWGADGATYRNGAYITAAINGTPGSGDMPTELRFGVAADGAAGASTAWILRSTSNLEADASNGGSIVLTKASTSVCQPVANAVSAAGSSISDATQLTAVHNRVTSVSAGQGVKLWDATTGTMITVSNLGSADLEVYPPNGSSGFNTASAGVALTLATATNGIGLFIKTAANTWIAIVGAGPDT